MQCLSYKGLDILSYADYLEEARGSDQAKLWLGVVLLPTGLWVLFQSLRHYKKTGKAPPARL